MYLNGKPSPNTVSIVVLSGFNSSDPRTYVKGEIVEVISQLAFEVIACGRARCATQQDYEKRAVTAAAKANAQIEADLEAAAKAEAAMTEAVKAEAAMTEAAAAPTAPASKKK